jgi:hypothetical protein
MSNDALMRWEWEGGTPDAVSEAARPEPAEKSDARSHDADQDEDPAEPRKPHV